MKSRSHRRYRRKGIALVVVLGLVVIVSLILVAFVTVMSLDRSASASYGQSLAAEQIGQGALNLVVADLRNEMGKDAPPDLTYPTRPLYTNVSSLNILPQPIGTNAAMPSLIKISATTSYIGSVTSGSLIASSVGTATPSKNGRYLDTARWSAPYLGAFPSTNNLPNWIIITRSGPTNAGTFGTTGNTLNNPALSNPNYAIGRVAYAIYDEGGLLDITVAGHPSSLTTAQINQLKGTLAGADLTAVGITGSNVDALVNWRNAASAATTSAYFSYMTNFVAANGFSKVAPGDRTFLSRQDLIKAAQKNIAGLTTANLTNLTTFTREKNAPSWGPQATVGTPVGNTIDYAGLSKSLSATNSLIPFVRHTAPATITTYKIDGTPAPYPVVAGDPIVSRRFPLDRLKWIGPNGPQNGGTTASIQACFGLLWDPLSGMWKYVGPTGNAELSTIKTLSQVVADHREPNFFELLQAGILSGSLAMEAHTNAGGTFNINMNYYTTHEKSATLHVFRIGASIISQAQGSIYPTVIEYDQSGQPWQAVGLANLPYLNMLGMLTGASSSTSLQCFMMFGLSNPQQASAGGAAARPPVRLRVKGQVTVANNYGRHTAGYARNPLNMPTNPYSYTDSLDATVVLSSSTNAGVNGFIDPHALLATDLATAPGPATAAGNAWAALPPIGGKTFAGLRLPDYVIDPTDTKVDEVPTLPSTIWADLWFAVNTNLANPFNCWLEFQNPSGIWVPYNFHAGINNQATWFCKSPGFFAGHLEAKDPSDSTKVICQLQPIDPPASASFFYFQKWYWETTDPRSLRFNYTQNRSASSATAEWARFLDGSMWSSASETADQVYGRLGLQVIPYLFGVGGWNPASLSRNNTVPQAKGASNGSKYAAYADPDGVQRIADSGLFMTPPNTNGWQGDPYAVSSTRVSDRPILLNRPFFSVADLGFVSRDYPWRTLDFFTANSADAGLLDIFTVDNSTDAVVRGRLNLNTQNAPALTAILNSTYTDVVGAAALANPSSVAASQTQLSSPASGTPLSGRDQIATRLVPSLSPASLGSTDNQYIKARKEGVPRALADVTQTRTWNLMIDIVTQAGRYAPGATAADQFVVEGQKRYWLHVAIDRFTGEVVDQQLESVTE